MYSGKKESETVASSKYASRYDAYECLLWITNITK